MKTIASIIANNGDLDALRRGDELLVRKGNFHPDLLIAYGGEGVFGGEIIKVSQLVPGVGEILVSPEMHFEVRANGVWYPYFRKDDVQPAVSQAFVLSVVTNNPDVMGFNLELQRGLIKLAREWDRKLEQREYHLAPVELRYAPPGNVHEEANMVLDIA